MATEKDGQSGDEVVLPGQGGVDDRVGDAHQLHVEQQRKEEKGDLLLGER